MDRTATHHRLKVLVHIDSNMERARIEVRGTVTAANIRALYIIARRARTLLPGREIVLDLTKARAVEEAITALHDPAQLTELSGEGTSAHPCRLSILDPRPPAAQAHGAHPHGIHSRGSQPAGVQPHASQTHAAQTRATQIHGTQPPGGESRGARRGARPKENA
jgi:hypothetical protein